MALWGYTMGGSAGMVHEVLCNQQIAEFTALEYGVHFVSVLGWDRVGLVGDNFSVLQRPLPPSGVKQRHPPAY